MLTPKTVPQQQQPSTGRLSPFQERAVTGKAAKAIPVAAFTSKTNIPKPPINPSRISRQAGTSGTNPEASSSPPPGGRRGGSGAKNSRIPNIGRSAKSIAKLFSGIETGPSSGAFSALGFQPSSFSSKGFEGFNVGQESFGADFGSVPTTPFVSGSPVSDAGAFIGALKEGGFVRKKT